MFCVLMVFLFVLTSGLCIAYTRARPARAPLTQQSDIPEDAQVQKSLFMTELKDRAGREVCVCVCVSVLVVVTQLLHHKYCIKY